jgi:hypothetical protein
MNDDFLKQFRKRPDPVFAEQLYQRINRKERIATMLRQISWSLAVIGILFIGAFSAIPSVRAATLNLIREVGGLLFVESEEFPAVDKEGAAPMSQTLTLEQADRYFDGSIVLPTYLPEGFAANPEISLLITFDNDAPEVIRVTWEKLDVYRDINGNFQEVVDYINLLIDYKPEVREIPFVYAGSGAVEEIDLNEKQAAIVRGLWNVEKQQYEFTSLAQLIWLQDENTIYTLSADTNQVSLDELLEMARSIQ